MKRAVHILLECFLVGVFFASLQHLVQDFSHWTFPLSCGVSHTRDTLQACHLSNTPLPLSHMLVVVHTYGTFSNYGFLSDTDSMQRC